MDENQSPTSSIIQRDQEDVSLRGLMVTLLENAKVLIIGPLLVGLAAFGVGYMLPRSFESVSIIQSGMSMLQSDQSALIQAAASLAVSAAVLDPVVVKLGLAKDRSVEEARSELRQSIKVTSGRADKLLTITVSATTPQQAQDRAYAVLHQTYIQISPKGAVRDRLETELSGAIKRHENAERAANILLKLLDATPFSSTAGIEIPRGYAELLTVAAENEKQITSLQSQLSVLSEAQLVQKPTLPQAPSQPKKALLAIGAAAATGVLLLLFVFIRQALRNTMADGGTVGKLKALRKASGLKDRGI